MSDFHPKKFPSRTFYQPGFKAGHSSGGFYHSRDSGSIRISATKKLENIQQVPAAQKYIEAVLGTDGVSRGGGAYHEYPDGTRETVGHMYNPENGEIAGSAPMSKILDKSRRMVLVNFFYNLQRLDLTKKIKALYLPIWGSYTVNGINLVDVGAENMAFHGDGIIHAVGYIQTPNPGIANKIDTRINPHAEGLDNNLCYVVGHHKATEIELGSHYDDFGCQASQTNMIRHAAKYSQSYARWQWNGASQLSIPLATHGEHAPEFLMFNYGGKDSPTYNGNKVHDVLMGYDYTDNEGDMAQVYNMAGLNSSYSALLRGRGLTAGGTSPSANFYLGSSNVGSIPYRGSKNKYNLLMISEGFTHTGPIHYLLRYLTLGMLDPGLVGIYDAWDELVRAPNVGYGQLKGTPWADKSSFIADNHARSNGVGFMKAELDWPHRRSFDFLPYQRYTYAIPNYNIHTVLRKELNWDQPGEPGVHLQNLNASDNKNSKLHAQKHPCPQNLPNPVPYLQKPKVLEKDENGNWIDCGTHKLECCIPTWDKEVVFQETSINKIVRLEAGMSKTIKALKDVQTLPDGQTFNIEIDDKRSYGIAFGNTDQKGYPFDGSVKPSVPKGTNKPSFSSWVLRPGYSYHINSKRSVSPITYEYAGAEYGIWGWNLNPGQMKQDQSGPIPYATTPELYNYDDSEIAIIDSSVRRPSAIGSNGKVMPAPKRSPFGSKAGDRIWLNKYGSRGMEWDYYYKFNFNLSWGTTSAITEHIGNEDTAVLGKRLISSYTNFPEIHGNPHGGDPYPGGGGKVGDLSAQDFQELPESEYYTRSDGVLKFAPPAPDGGTWELAKYVRIVWLRNWTSQGNGGFYPVLIFVDLNNGYATNPSWNSTASFLDHGWSQSTAGAAGIGGVGGYFILDRFPGWQNYVLDAQPDMETIIEGVANEFSFDPWMGEF